MALFSGWLTTAPAGVITSVRSVVSVDRVNTYWVAQPIYYLVTKTSTTTVTLYKAMTYACASGLAAGAGWNAQTVDANGNITASSTAEVSLANEAGAYNVTRTQFACSIVVYGPYNA
jgi:hypothetical protein